MPRPPVSVSLPAAPTSVSSPSLPSRAFAPLFPVFAGTLRARGSELSVDGLYAPPGGVVGRVADRLLLHLAANATARWLLGEIARAGR